jgi:predicted Zn-dependent protease
VRFHRSLAALSLALTLSTPLALADGLPDLGDTARGELSAIVERRIGESIMNDIRLHDPQYLDDPEIEWYVNELGQRLAASANDAGTSFNFFAMRDPTINAFAMFGGYIGVNSGLLLSAQTESEVAGVLAHEISHVTQRHLARQIEKEKQVSAASMLALVVGILAARSNSQVAAATMTASQAAAIQSQLSFTRDYEREADRVGFEVLAKSGFDVRGMASFFERLQKAGRVYENNAPVYLRTHPLTTERISDIENRVARVPYKQVPDSLDFQLVRAKLRAQDGVPHDAIRDFELALREQKYSSEVATRYGYAIALQRDRQWAAAERELAPALKLKSTSPLVERLAAELRAQQGDLPAAKKRFAAAMQRFPTAHALRYGYVETLLALGEAEPAKRFLQEQVQLYSQDARLHTLLAKTYATLGKLGAQHRAQAEAYLVQGQLGQAIEQLGLAQKQADNDFYEQSVIDARLRELKARQAEEAKQRR